jgi:hypothetical protein
VNIPPHSPTPVPVLTVSGSSGGSLAGEHQLTPTCSARSRYPLLFGGRIAMLSVILAFPINGSSFFRVPPLATPWLPSVSVRHVSIATTKALRLLPSLRVRSLWRLASAYCRCIAWLRSHCGSMLPLCAWTLLIRCRPLPGFGCGREQEFAQVHRAPFSCTFATVSDPGRTGRRLAFLVASRTVPAGSTAKTPALVLSWLNPAASLLTVNASCQPRG